MSELPTMRGLPAMSEMLAERPVDFLDGFPVPDAAAVALLAELARPGRWLAAFFN
jgi:hypothetical protein